MKVGLLSIDGKEEHIDSLHLLPETPEEAESLQSIWRAFNTRYMRLPMTYYGDFEMDGVGTSGFKIVNSYPIAYAVEDSGDESVGEPPGAVPSVS